MIDESRAAIIRLAFELAEADHGDPTIARRLNALGHRTLTQGVPSRPANQHGGGQPWYRRRVQALLTNPVENRDGRR